MEHNRLAVPSEHLSGTSHTHSSPSASFGTGSSLFTSSGPSTAATTVSEPVLTSTTLLDTHAVPYDCRGSQQESTKLDALSQDDSMLYQGFSQDMDEIVEGHLTKGDELRGCFPDTDMDFPAMQCPDLSMCDALDESCSASDASDLDVDSDHAPNLSESQTSTGEAVASECEVVDLPAITNDELEEALEALNLSHPVQFPDGATRLQRRAFVKDKLYDYAVSIVVQLTLSTTPNPSTTLPPLRDETQQESQYRAIQAKIASRGCKPSYDPMELKLRSRHGHGGEPYLRTIKFPSTVSSTKQLAIVLRLLDLLTDCLADEAPSTLRDIYYRDVKLFGSQKVVDTLVDDIAATLGIRRRDLNVVAASKGLVHGFVCLQTDQGQILDCETASSGHLIPPGETIESMIVDSDVRFILVVEKETLSSSAFISDPTLGKSVLITGKGYPDIATRELVKALCNKLPENIPVLCLVDADPHGLDIFLNYRDGSKAMSFDKANLVSPRLQWLGLSAQDMFSLSVDQDCRLPMTPHDIKKGLSLLRMPSLDERMRRHIQHLLHSRVKAEIQLLASEDPVGLLPYLRSRISPFLAP